MFALSGRFFCKFVLLLGIIFSYSSLNAAPLKNVPVVVKQPDGTMMQLYASGDEFYNVLHDALGYTVVKDPNTGAYVYAEKKNGQLVPSSHPAGLSDPILLDISPNLADEVPVIRQRRMTSPIIQGRTELSPIVRMSTTGTVNNLVVFIRFSDQDQFVESLNHFETFFNAQNDVSMRDYFDEVSSGQLDLVSTFYPSTSGPGVISFQDSHTRNYYLPYDAISNPEGYEGGEYGSERIVREHTLLKKAVEAISAQVPTSLDVDSDDDGNVDNVVFVVQGGPDGWSTLLWPHQWVLYSESVTINGARVFDYNFQLQETLDVGVLCHEMFHSLGAPDLYNYDTNDNPVGPWDLMASTADIPQHMSAFMKMRYGEWFDSIPEITASGTYTLDSLSISPHAAYKIYSEDSVDEYFVLEHRRATGRYESSLPGSGLLVYRVDSTRDGLGNASGPPNEVYLFRPDGNLTNDGDVSQAHLTEDEGRTIFGSGQNPYPFFSDGTTVGDFSIREIGGSGTDIQFEVSFCRPDCSGKNCGDDGCGGSCGECLPNSDCVAGVCSDCIPEDCTTLECGNDGCGGSCGDCESGENCSDDGFCISFCPMADLGSAIGNAVVTGSTTGGENHFEPTCSSNSYAADATYSWTAPEHGIFLFDTNSSSYDTILLALRNDCDGEEIACDDDSGDGSRSQFQMEMQQGEVIILVIDGYSSHTGSYQLNITQLCMPDCENKECGDDGCGGSCGECQPNAECIDGLCDVCVPFDCTARECGADGCGGSCGDCPEGEKCSDDGACFTYCPVDDLGSLTGNAVVTGTTSGRDDDFSPSCQNSSNAGDITYTWQAPETGTFVIDTDNSSFDTVLTILSQSCLGEELACDDDGGVSTRSRIEIELTEGDVIVIVIDGYSSNSGSFVLNITPPCHPDCEGKDCGDDGCGGTCGECEDGYLCDDNGLCSICVADCEGKTCGDDGCGGSCGECEGFDVCDDSGLCVSHCPMEDLGTVFGDAVATGTTVGGYNLFAPSCQDNSNANDVSYLWTAPVTGQYTITTEGSSFDTVLSVLDGECDGEVLACDDDSGNSTRSMVELSVVQGQSVIFVIDAYSGNSGNYQLNIGEPCIPDCDGKMCGDDGCGNSCGECGIFEACDENAQCVDRPVATVPFSDSFDSDTFSEYWTTSSTGNGRIRISGEYEPYSDPYHVLMDSEGSNALNGLELLVDLSQSSDISLSFMHKAFNDESHTMPASFEGESLTDGVALSTDGLTWRRLVDLTASDIPNETYTRFEVHLGDWATAQGVTLSAMTLIRFQQYDNSTIDADGFAFDDVEIDACFPDCTGKICGDDGCGGSCGECGELEICSADGSSCDSACPTDDLGTSLGSPVVSGSTQDMGDFFDPSCSFLGDSSEVTYLWQAPENGYYAFDTEGSAFNTILSMLDSDCAGEELECSISGSIDRYFGAGEQVVIVIDGDMGQSGEFNLNIELTCVPDCDGKQCGDNGCGESCGECTMFETCSSEGLCESREAAGFPFLEEFEDVEFAPYWSQYSTSGGNIRLSSYNEPQGGTQHVLMDASGSNALNELTLLADLSGQDNIMLSFWHKHFSDESHVMPDQFEGHDYSDGVALSVDGETWYKIKGLDASEGISGTYKEFRVDIAEALTLLGLEASEQTLIKFQQYDNAAILSDGFAFDTIALEPCIHDCTGKICGDDGCGGSCGECDGFTECSDDGTACVSYCPLVDIRVETGQAIATGSTVGFGNYFTPSCSYSSAASEVTFLWSAPQNGTYRIDTTGSSFDTVLYLLEGSCGGEELACDDDDGSIRTSTIERNMVADETVVIVIDGYGSADGDFLLNIEQTCFPACNGLQCGDDGCGGSCGECDSGTICDDNGQCVGCIPDCNGKECGDDGCSGSCGTCEYNEECSDAGLCEEFCPLGDLGSLVGESIATGNTAGNGDHFRASCNVQTSTAPEETLLWTAPATGIYTISTTGSDFDTVLAVLDGECAGDELACNDFVGSDYFPSIVDVTVTEGQVLTIVIDGYGTNSGNYVLNIEQSCIPSCDGKQCGDDGCGGSCGDCGTDGIFCNGEESCSDEGLCVHSGDPCQDGDACNSQCNEMEQTCFSALDTVCDDNLYCNGEDTCDGQGHCTVHAGDPCEGGDACNNSCNEADQNCFSAASTSCNDDLFCNGEDTCDGQGGCTVHVGDPCVGGEMCNDTCNEQRDSCQNPNGSGCNDGLFCTLHDACIQGECRGAGSPCNDGVNCTNDICEESTDSCRFEPDDTVCLDGLYCNGEEFCDVSNGCLNGTAPDVDDGIDCTEDQCLEGNNLSDNIGEIRHQPWNQRCDDGSLCTEDICDADSGCRWSPDNEGQVCTTASNLEGSCENGICVPDCTQNEDCNDGIECTQDVCDLSIGKCTYRAMDNRCDDDNDCTDDSCNPTQGCIFDKDDTNACDDGLFCTAIDYCSDGSCMGEGNPCNDTVNCTVDSCLEDSDTCRFTPDDAACDDTNICTADVCDADLGCQYSPDQEDETCTNASGNAGTCTQGICIVECTNDADCNDGIACTLERCEPSSGKCVVRAYDNLCDDDNPCTDNVCSTTEGCRFIANDTLTCDDDAFCTVSDRCVGGECVGEINDCNDGIDCTVDRCDEQADICNHLTDDSACDDGSICTADSCQEDSGCQYEPDHEQASCLTSSGMVGACESGLCIPECENDGDCSDGIGCTNDRCDMTTGTCIFEAVDALCDDSNPCTSDSCSPFVGCQRTFDDTATCDDGNFCTANDRCEAGNCIGSGSPCNDGIACTVDRCNEQADTCMFDPRDSLCDDGNFCTVDSCDDQQGCLNPATNEGLDCTTGLNQSGTCFSGVCTVECVSHSDCDDFLECTLDYCDDITNLCMHRTRDALCNDNNPCTDDFCDATVGCQAVEDDTNVCDDGLFCTDVDSCSNGNCIGQTRDCDDHVSCTIDACDENANLCTHQSQDSLCNDNNPCTDDFCDEALDCQAVEDDTNTCNDGLFCTVSDYCQNGNCIGDERNCSTFEDECNWGVCDENDRSCASLPKDDNTSCNDGEFCTETDVCLSGVCTGTAERDCSAFDGECTVGACDEMLDQCFADPVMDLTPCSDGVFCTVEDHCEDGICVGDDMDCSDLDAACTVGACDETQMECYAQSLPDGVGCTDESLCTVNDSCLNGVCTGEVIDCSDDDPCTEDLCLPESGCDYPTMNDWSDCSEDGAPSSACFEGTCEVLAENDRCEDATELVEDQAVVLSMTGYHASRLVEPPCVSDTLTRNDAYYRISTELARYYDVTVETTSAVDLTVVAWSDCGEDAVCLGSVERTSFTGMEILTQLEGADGEIILQVLVEPSDGSDEVEDITITVNGYYLFDGGDEDLTEGDDDFDTDILESDNDIVDDADADTDANDSDMTDDAEGSEDDTDAVAPGDEDDIYPNADVDISGEEITRFSIGSGGCRSTETGSFTGIVLAFIGLLWIAVRRRRQGN